MMLKAWHVWDPEYEECHVIVYAKKRSEAIMKSPFCITTADYIHIRARREPWADKYAETLVIPSAELFAHGWWVECQMCHAVDDEFAAGECGEVFCRECAKELEVHWNYRLRGDLK